MSFALYINTKSVMKGGSLRLGFMISETLFAMGCQNIILAAQDSKSGLCATTVTKNRGALVYCHQTDLSDTQSVQSMVDFAEDKIQRKLHGAKYSRLAKARKSQPFCRLIKHEEFANLVNYFLSDPSDAITGSIIDFDQEGRWLISGIAKSWN